MKWVNLMSISLLFLISLGGCLESETFTLTITNGLSRDIRHIYVSSVDSETFGEDDLLDQALSPGQSISVELSEDTYDIRAIDEDGNKYDRLELRMNKAHTWTVRPSNRN